MLNALRKDVSLIILTPGYTWSKLWKKEFLFVLDEF